MIQVFANAQIHDNTNICVTLEVLPGICYETMPHRSLRRSMSSQFMSECHSKHRHAIIVRVLLIEWKKTIQPIRQPKHILAKPGCFKKEWLTICLLSKVIEHEQVAILFLESIVFVRDIFRPFYRRKQLS